MQGLVRGCAQPGARRLFAVLAALALGACGSDSHPRAADTPVPADIAAVFAKPAYKDATWGLRVVDLASGDAVIDLRSSDLFYVGSVRKTFTVGQTLNEVGPAKTYDTPVFRQGTVDGTGVLQGDLIVVASGDLTMGGRTNADGTIAIADFDHNEAEALGNAQLTTPDPLAGYAKLAASVAAAGIKSVTGDVIIDDRLFQPFNFRDQFDVTPILVNDDVVDVTINPTTPGAPPSVAWRPQSQAFAVTNQSTTSGPGSPYTLKVDPELPSCIGVPGCSGAVAGELPVDFVPPLTQAFPLVQTFRIVKPSNYARTVFIEALQAAGVGVGAAPVAPNPVAKLPPKGSYAIDAKVGELVGMPYSDSAKLILKVSYNIGSDVSLVLFGLARGVDSLSAALSVEKNNLTSQFAIPEAEYHFVDGHGGGETKASNRAVTTFLTAMTAAPAFSAFFDAFPILAVDGSLASVKDFQADPSLAGAAGRVRAKTGTFVTAEDGGGMLVKGQAFGGYIDAKSGRRLVYQLVVNNVPIATVDDLLSIFQDEGRVSAILWRDN